MSNSPFQFASGMVGHTEAPTDSALRDYLTTGGANLDPATTAWCAAFVNSSLGHAGIKGTGSNLARSFLGYGTPVATPQRGDIAVFSRGDPNGPLGHVGFFDQLNPDGSIRVLAGNQGNAVSYGNLPASSLLGYRRPGSAAGSTAAPAPAGAPAQAFGDVVAPPPVTPAAAPPGIGDAIATFLQSRQDRDQAAAAEKARRQALFGGGLAGLYG